MIEIPKIDPWANESKANVRWLSRRTGFKEADCLAALRDAQGNLQEARRRLLPAVPVHKFPDWYYLGPYRKVDDPDRDLPTRIETELSAHDIAKETDQNFGGERLIAPFNDANSMEDIRGCLLVAGGYPKFGARDLIALGMQQGNLAEAADRLRVKIRRSKNVKRNACFEDVIRAVEFAKNLYFDRQYDDGKSVLYQAIMLLQEGNKPK